MFGRKDVSGAGSAMHVTVVLGLHFFPPHSWGRSRGNTGTPGACRKGEGKWDGGITEQLKLISLGAKEKGKALSGEISARVLFLTSFVPLEAPRPDVTRLVPYFILF